MANTTHVTYKNKQWEVKKANAERASAVFRTKKEAVAAARVLSKKAKTELVIHNKKDGQIAGKDSHGNDPRNVPG